MDGDFRNQLDEQNPWPGLNPFTEDLAGYFHGRDEDIAELDRRVKRASLTVLFAKSGLGKTSLVRAGLFPVLRKEGYLPIYIRLDPKSGSSFVRQIKEALKRAIGESAERLDLEPPRLDDSYTLWEYFHADNVNFWTEKNRLLTPLIVLDQFEEIFSLATVDQRTPLIGALAELVENRCPPALEQELAADPERAKKFDFGKQGCKVLLSFREDFLAHFVPFRQIMPSLSANPMRLAAMTFERARDAIERSGGHLLEPGVSERIVAAVASGSSNDNLETAEGTQEGEVEPYLLSVFCRELNEKRKYYGRAKITADLLESQNQILDDFYTKAVGDLGDAVSAFIEDRLLNTFGFRIGIDEEEALALPGITNEVLDTLVDRRLLRREERLNRTQIELTHDKLASVIKKHRDERVEERRRREFARQITAKRNRAAGWTLVGVVSVFMLAIVGFLSYVAKEAAEDQTAAREELTGQILRAAEISEQFRFLPGGLQLVDAVDVDIDASIQRFMKEHSVGIDGPTGTARVHSVLAALARGDLKSVASRIFEPSADEEQTFSSLLNGVKDVFDAAAYGIRGQYNAEEVELWTAAPQLDQAGVTKLAAAAWIDWKLQYGSVLGLRGDSSQGEYARAAQIASDLLTGGDWAPSEGDWHLDDQTVDKIMQTAKTIAPGSANYPQIERWLEKWEQATLLWAAKRQSADALATYRSVEGIIVARIGAIEANGKSDPADSRSENTENTAEIYWKTEYARFPWRRAALEADPKDAVADYKMALDRAGNSKLTSIDPVRNGITIAFTRLQLAKSYLKQQDWTDANSNLGKSYAVFKDLGDLDPDDSYWVGIVGDEDEAFGDVALGQGNPADAKSHYRDALTEYVKLNGFDDGQNKPAATAITRLNDKLTKIPDASDSGAKPHRASDSLRPPDLARSLPVKGGSARAD